MAPNISVREYIRWIPDAASEPTSTLVLTSPEKRFVDIRIIKAIEGLHNNNLPGNVLPTSRLDWGFAGVSSTDIQTDSEGRAVVHSRWHHWVDSRTKNAEEVKDEGDIYPKDDGRTLEVGKMVNPATGLMTQYEECWLDIEPATTDDDESNGTRACTVLQLYDEVNEARGMVIKIGQFCQGVLRVGEYFSLERWLWENGAGWRRQIRIGDLWTPCGPVLEGERLVLGGQVKYGDYVWEVVEMSDF